MENNGTPTAVPRIQGSYLWLVIFWQVKEEIIILRKTFLKNKEHRHTITFINDSNLEIKLVKMPIKQHILSHRLVFQSI